MHASSAGTSDDAETVVSADLIEWADLVLAMESVHKRKLQQRFGKYLRAKQVIVLGIRDNYAYMDADLIEMLKEKVTPHMKAKGLRLEGS